MPATQDYKIGVFLHYGKIHVLIGRSDSTPAILLFTSRDSNRDPHSRAPSLFSRNNQDPDLTSFKTLEDDDYGFKSRFSSSQVRTKGGLISESFSLWFESPKKVLNHTPEHIHLKVKRIHTYGQESDLPLSFGDSSQTEKNYEI